jgi:hypothetical protein
VLLGRGDPSYPHPFYFDSFSQFCGNQPEMRRLVAIDVPEPRHRHNLWQRKNAATYEEAIAAMVRFFQGN